MPQTTFTVDLTGTQETPPNASAASGAGVVVWDSDTSTAAYEFIVSGLDFGPALGLAPMTAITDDDVTAMHFHNGDRGVAAPVVFGQFNPAQDADLQVLMNDDGSWDISGVWDMTDPATVPITDFAVLLDSASPGLDVPLYWNNRRAADVIEAITRRYDPGLRPCWIGTCRSPRDRECRLWHSGQSRRSGFGQLQSSRLPSSRVG